MCLKVPVIALLALLCQRGSAFQFTQNVDFTQCYEQLVAMNDTIFNNFTQYSLWNSSKMFSSDPRQLVLTLKGCESLCGDGYQLWPAQDTLQRLSLFILPAIVLLTHLQFSPLPWFNMLAVVIHAVGDPIDSLWSVLTRLETYRRLSRVAQDMDFEGSDDYKNIATVWAAYEELCWQDASLHYRQSSDLRSGRPLTKQEKYHIISASHELSSNRQRSLLAICTAIATLIIALVSAIFRTIEQTEIQNTRILNETAHTIALVTLLFVFIPLVIFSGNIGSFVSTSIAVVVIERLNRDIQTYDRDKTQTDQPSRSSNERQLFPPLDLNPDIGWTSSTGATTDPYAENSNKGSDRINASTNLQKWPGMASFSGMNSSWRPSKKSHVQTTHGSRSPLLLWTYSIFFTLVGSCAPALLISFTNHAGQMTSSFGCRSLSWVVIVSAWLASSGTDLVLCWLLRHKARTLWISTITKDAAFVLFIMLVVLAQQIGLYNSCWCRSNELSTGASAIVNLNPYTSAQWTDAKILWSTIPAAGLVCIGAAICIIECWGGGHGMWPLSNDQEGIQMRLVALEKYRDELDGGVDRHRRNTYTDPEAASSSSMEKIARVSVSRGSL